MTSEQQSFLASLQNTCAPGVWSRGIALSREASVIRDREEEGELRVRVVVPGRPVHPQVTLWWDEEPDWHCDCGDRADICVHIVAAAMAWRGGRIVGQSVGQANAPDGAPTREPGAAQTSFGPPSGTVEYRFLRESGSLALERWVNGQRLSGTLVSRVSKERLAATRADFAIDLALGTAPRRVPESGELGAALRALETIGRATLDGVPIAIRAKGPVAKVVVERSGPGWRVHRENPLGDLFRNGAILREGALTPFATPRLELGGGARLDASGFETSDAEILFGEVIPRLREQIEVELRCPTPEVVRAEPRLRVRFEAVEGGFHVSPEIEYAGIGVVQNGEFRPIARERLVQVVARDRGAEQKLLATLDPEWRTPRRVDGGAAIELARSLSRKGVETTGARIRERGVLSPVFRWETGVLFQGKGIDRDGIELAGEAGLAAWRRGERWVGLADGSFAELPADWLERHGEAALRLLDSRRESVPGNARALAWLGLELESQGARPDWVERIAASSAEGRGSDPEGLGVQLRSYQRKGVSWLRAHREAGTGALLADEMGLGKTLQAIAAIEPRASAGRASLVAVPTSVLRAWEGELARARPAIRVSVFHGSGRGSVQALDPRVDVVLTTHGTLRASIEDLAPQPWDAFVLDEAQAIRNLDSQLARAARAIPARWRVALSGTPVENRLEDLWSLFDFLNPGLIAKDLGADGKLRLTRPFTLRRLKSEVAVELPPRSEVVKEAELSAPEREAYLSVLAAARTEISRLGADQPLATLEALLRLRQACCDPALLPGLAGEAESSKTALLCDLLEEAAAGGHRSLVFSQWTRYLDRIEPALSRRGVPFVRLDGSTRDRAGVVERFQAADGPPVFLISLKAGGIGLTLTAADHVFLTDPWWNPAVEEQAASRAHRIGQDRPVLVTRLVARDTIEGKVLALQATKRDLAFEFDASAARTALSREEILALL